jgi:hypothetical protein
MGDAALIGHRDLAVEDQRRQAGGGELVERFAEQRGAVVTVAADQLEVIATDDRQQPVPVMLDLVQPALAVGRLGAGRNDLAAGRVEAVRLGSPRRAMGRSAWDAGIEAATSVGMTGRSTASLSSRSSPQRQRSAICCRA